MERLSINARVFFAAAAMCLATLATALALRFPFWEYCTVFALMGGALTAALFISARKTFMTAKAIADSAVICIQPAIICGPADKEKEDEKLRGGFGIYISCFGILIGTKIIEFNQNGIWLRSVEIGRDYIAFCYGETGGEQQNIRLLYSRPGGEALAGIIESFRKETGVVPVIAD